MGNVLFIVWRESLEAVLVIGILHSFLSRQGMGKGLLRRMWMGVWAGVILSLALGILTFRIESDLGGRTLELFQVGVLGVASLLMTQMVLWMIRNGRRIKSQLEADLNGALLSQGSWAVAFVSASAVAREGAETVVYLYGLSVENSLSWIQIYSLSAAGFALAFLTSWVISKGVGRINYSVFFNITGAILLLSAAGMLVQVVNRLIALDVLPSLLNPVWNTSAWLDGNHGIGKFMASFVGYQARPSLMAVLAYLLYWTTTACLLGRKSPSAGK